MEIKRIKRAKKEVGSAPYRRKGAGPRLSMLIVIWPAKTNKEKSSRSSWRSVVLGVAGNSIPAALLGGHRTYTKSCCYTCSPGGTQSFQSKWHNCKSVLAATNLPWVFHGQRALKFLIPLPLLTAPSATCPGLSFCFQNDVDILLWRLPPGPFPQSWFHIHFRVDHLSQPITNAPSKFAKSAPSFVSSPNRLKDKNNF